MNSLYLHFSIQDVYVLNKCRIGKVIAEMLLKVVKELHYELAKLYNRYLELQKVSIFLQISEIIEEGVINIKLHKQFIRVIANRLNEKIDPNQLIEQAGFRSG